MRTPDRAEPRIRVWQGSSQDVRVADARERIEFVRLEHFRPAVHDELYAIVPGDEATWQLVIRDDLFDAEEILRRESSDRFPAPVR